MSDSEDFATRLDEADAPSMTLLPDGSVDRRFRMLNDEGAPETRERFAERVAGGDRAFETERVAVEPGGQAVNAAEQAVALGADASLYGHLDHEVFDGVDAATTSMGEPASVGVYEFHDGAVMFDTPSPDIQSWTYDDLRAAGGGSALDADAVVWTNWASVPNANDALRRAADRPGDGDVFVLDPGDLSARSGDDVRGLCDALAALGERYDVTVSVDESEAEALADATRANSARAALDRVRSRTGIEGVVVHGTEEAVAATAGGTRAVPNFEAAAISRFVGAGDRFSAGLAFALANGWNWRASLTLGNACASQFVSTGSTGDRDDLAAFVSEADDDR